MAWFRRLNLIQSFTALIAFFSLSFLLYAGWSFKTLNEVKVNGPVYQRIVLDKDLIADVLPPPEYIIESYLVVLELSGADARPQQENLVLRLQKLEKEYTTRHEFWSRQDLDDDLRTALLKQAHEPAVAFYRTAFQELIPALQRQDTASAAAALKNLKHLYEIHRQAIDKVVQQASGRNKKDEAEAQERVDSASMFLLGALLASLGIAVLLAIVIVRGIFSRLGCEPEQAAAIVTTIAAGDLSGAITTSPRDQSSMLHAIRNMRDSLARLIDEVRISAAHIATASSQIASGNADLSARTEEQASYLEETASSMEQLTSTVRKNAESVHQASQMASSTAEAAHKGGAIVTEVIGTMGAIQTSSSKIMDIISVIDGIAFQTNILALNAAVEAARAGEQGRGFAVVAMEVRSLAQRCAAAAKEIKELIYDSVEKVDGGIQLVDQAGAAMQDIVLHINRVNSLMREIATASAEQSAGIDQVNTAVIHMDDMTQRNAALVEQAAAGTQSMLEQAQKLSRAVGVFKLEKDAEHLKPDLLPAPVPAHGGLPAAAPVPAPAYASLPAAPDAQAND